MGLKGLRLASIGRERAYNPFEEMLEILRVEEFASSFLTTAGHCSKFAKNSLRQNQFHTAPAYSQPQKQPLRQVRTQNQPVQVANSALSLFSQQLRSSTMNCAEMLQTPQASHNASHCNYRIRIQRPLTDHALILNLPHNPRPTDPSMTIPPMTIPPMTIPPAEKVVTPESVKSTSSSSTSPTLEKLVVIETEICLGEGSNHIYEEIVERVESAIIATVMKETNHNLTHAAKLLGISRPTLRSKIRQHMPYRD
jgi:DNA-binding protein Fis